MRISTRRASRPVPVPVVLSGLRSITWFSGTPATTSAARTALVLYLGPLYAAALAWFVLGEPLHAYHAVGALIILPGIFLASQAKQTR